MNMYCSNCANEVKPDLHYCNNCGQRISGKAETVHDPIARTLSSALIYVGIAAVIGFVMLVKELLNNDISDGRLIVLAGMYLASIFGIFYFILQRIGSGKSEVRLQHVNYSAENQQLKPAETNQLEATKQPPASVTVDTTRTLDEVQLDRD